MIVSLPAPPLKIFALSSPIKISSPLPPITCSISIIVSVLVVLPLFFITVCVDRFTLTVSPVRVE